MPNALAEMKANQWAKAKVLFDKVIERDGPSGKEKFGGQFGVIWYNKGYTELQLARQAKGDPDKALGFYEEAKQSFEWGKTLIQLVCLILIWPFVILNCLNLI